MVYMKKILIIANCLLVAGCSVSCVILNAKLDKVRPAPPRRWIGDACCRTAEAYVTSHPAKR